MTTLERRRQQYLRRSNLPVRYYGAEFPAEFSDKLVDYWLENVLSGKSIKAEGGLGVTGVGIHFVGGTAAQQAAAAAINRINEQTTAPEVLFKYSAQNFMNVDSPYKYATYADFLSLKKLGMDQKGEDREETMFDIEGYHGRLSLREDWGNVRLLLLADVDLPTLTEYSQSSLSDLLISRYNKALPTILVSKLSNQDLRRMYGKAVEDVLTEGFLEVKVK